MPKGKERENGSAKWQNKIRRLRQFLKGWAANMNAAYTKEKQELLRKADESDKVLKQDYFHIRSWTLSNVLKIDRLSF